MCAHVTRGQVCSAVGPQGTITILNDVVTVDHTVANFGEWETIQNNTNSNLTLLGCVPENYDLLDDRESVFRAPVS
jgi:hypothetical protein